MNEWEREAVNDMAQETCGTARNALCLKISCMESMLHDFEILDTCRNYLPRIRRFLEIRDETI